MPGHPRTNERSSEIVGMCHDPAGWPHSAWLLQYATESSHVRAVSDGGFSQTYPVVGSCHAPEQASTSASISPSDSVSASSP